MSWTERLSSRLAVAQLAFLALGLIVALIPPISIYAIVFLLVSMILFLAGLGRKLRRRRSARRAGRRA